MCSVITGALGVLVGWSARLQRGQRSCTVLAMPARRLHAKNCTCAVGLVVRGTRRSQAGNRVTLGAGGQSAGRAATDLLSRAVASWIGLLESPAWLPPRGGLGTGPEADLTSLKTKLLSSEKVLAVLPLREGLALPGSPGRDHLSPSGLHLHPGFPQREVYEAPW